MLLACHYTLEDLLNLLLLKISFSKVKYLNNAVVNTFPKMVVKLQFFEVRLPPCAPLMTCIGRTNPLIPKITSSADFA